MLVVLYTSLLPTNSLKVDEATAVILLMVVAAAAATAAPATCPTGEFASIGSKRYYWSDTAMNYDDAMASCPAKSTLVVFQDAAEMATLADKGNAGTVW